MTENNTAQAGLTDDEIRGEIHNAIGFAFDPGETQEVNAADLMNVAHALLSKLRAPVADERHAVDPCGYVAVKSSAVDWLKDKFPALAIKAGLCELIGGRLYTITRLMRDHDAALASAPVAGEAQPGRPPVGALSMDGARLPASEVAALRDFLAAHARPSDDTLWDQTLAERDEYHDMADKLANAIADHLLVEIGEHSSSNCPWMRALEAIQNAAPQASAESVDLPGIDADRLRTIAASGSQTAMTNALLNVARALKQPQATVVDKSANLQGSQVDGSTEMQGQVDGGQQPKRYVVLKASGSRYAYVNDTQEGRSINRFDVLKGDGWRYAHEFADRMNNEHARAALSATQPEQGERDA